MIDKDTRAARAFYAAVAKFSYEAKPWSTNAIFHTVTPDEQNDITLISQNVYGRRDEFLAVMAAAGISNVEDTVPQKTLVLPNDGTLRILKRQTNFESIPELREDFAPTWSEDN